MGLKPLLAAALLLSLALAGCSKDGDGGGPSTTSGSGSATGTSTAANRPPTASLNVSVAEGLSPLAVNFTLEGSDPDGDALNWTLAFGDGNATDGASLPGDATHTYAAGGNFTAVLTVSDGNLTASANVTIAVAAAGALPDPLHFEGTLTAVPFVPGVGSPNEFVEESSATHEFAFTGTPATMTLTLAYEGGTPGVFTDVDFFVTDPSGEETASEAEGAEPPLEVESPAPGQWSVRVFAYGGEGEVPYTLDVAFA